jgi:uncharacterized protein (TIGR03437 family)
MKVATAALFLALAGFALAQPSINPSGIVSSATFAQGTNGNMPPIAPGALVTIFGSFPGATAADADSVPFSTSLGGVSVTFNGVPAPVIDVAPGSQFVNVQVPFDVFANGVNNGNVSVVVTVNNQISTPQVISGAPQAPGVFTVPPGSGNALLVNMNDFTVAAPVGSNVGAASHPISRGSYGFFYATGLGSMIPAVSNGDGGSDGLVHNAVLPQVTIGGIQAQVLFAGQAEGSPGVYQLNIIIPENAPTGNNVELRVISFDGTQSSPAGVSTIAVQ